MFIGYLSHNEVPSTFIQNLFKIRDISLKPIRYQIFKILKSFSEGVLDSYFYSIPSCFLLTFFPRLAEYFFRYNENELNYEDSILRYRRLQQKVFPLVLKKQTIKSCQNELLTENNKNDINNQKKTSIIFKEENDNNSRDFNINSNMEIEKKSKRVKAYMNFIYITQNVIKTIEKDNFKTTSQNNLPQQLSPIYVQRIEAQMNSNEINKNDRVNEINKRCRILRDDKIRPKEFITTNKLFKDDDVLVDNVNQFLDNFEVVDVNQLDNICKIHIKFRRTRYSK